MVAVQAGEQHDGQPVAFATCLVIAGEAQLQNMAVRAEHQGKGLGRMLLARLLQECGCLDSVRGAACLLEVRTDNAAAVQLYTSLGFEKTGTRKRFYPDGGDALLMERPPGPHVAKS